MYIRTDLRLAQFRGVGWAPAGLSGLGAISDTIAGYIDAAAAKYGISSTLLRAVVSTESAGNPSVVSSKGAVGLMQLMPATAAQYGVSNPYDPAQNIDGGAHLLSDLLGKYNGDVSLALSAYNAGAGNVAKYGGIPPFPETQSYVAKILSALGLNSSAGSTTANSGDVEPADYVAPAIAADSGSYASGLSSEAWIGLGVVAAGLLLWAASR